MPHPTDPVMPADDMIRRIFLAHGFTIKEGQTDLKPYVFEAAHALIEAVARTLGAAAEANARERVEAAEADAARYRWLCETVLRYLPLSRHVLVEEFTAPLAYGGSINEAIDSAIAQEIERAEARKVGLAAAIDSARRTTKEAP